MIKHTRTPADAPRHARARMALIVSGVVDLALAGLFLGWGAELLQLEQHTARLIAAVLAAAGVSTLFIAALAFGRKGTGCVPDEGEGDNEPIVRR